MRNIQAEVKGKKLIITIDLNEKGEPSKSGKNNVVATTGGLVEIPESGGKLGLNFIVKPK